MFKKVRSGVIALAVLGAIAVGASAVAGAASNSGTTGATGSQRSSGSSAQRPDPATLSHGPGETVLTDGTASKVKQAALAKVPGATVLRVETDSEGSPYEAHLRKSDGTEVTAKVNKQFEVTAVDNGFGAGPPGGSRP
jgi:uncharacterized membrane protein YkoI